MIVSNRQLSILGGVAGVLVVVTVLLFAIQPGPSTAVKKGTPLIQGLALDNVRKITVQKGDNTVTLVRRGTGFVIAERHHYPAAVKKVNDLIKDIHDIELSDEVTRSADNHEKLGVKKEGGDDTTIVCFYGEAKPEKDAEKKDAKKEADAKKETPIVGVVIGKSATSGGGSYVRLLKSDTVYASTKGVWLTTEVSSYIDTDVCDVKKDDVEKVTVSLPDETYTVSRNDDKKIVLGSVPKGKKQKDYEVESAFDALSSFSFSDVVTEPPADLKLDATCVAVTKKHLTYIVRLGKMGDKHYAKLAAKGPSAAEIQRASRIGRDEPKEKLEEKDKIVTAAKAAHDFTERHGPWLYELSSWKAEKMRKPVKDLVEDSDEAPEEIAASHILVGYKGAEKADDKITRSKDEAKTRAEELLKKVKEDGADFAKIAEKESDGPSKTKGGDLGTFKKKAMHENFEEAAWKLKVDDISDLVETPFGFHIIKRTK